MSQEAVRKYWERSKSLGHFCRVATTDLPILTASKPQRFVPGDFCRTAPTPEGCRLAELMGFCKAQRAQILPQIWFVKGHIEFWDVTFLVQVSLGGGQAQTPQNFPQRCSETGCLGQKWFFAGRLPGSSGAGGLAGVNAPNFSPEASRFLQKPKTRWIQVWLKKGL